MYYYLWQRHQLKIPLDTDSKTLEKANEENKPEAVRLLLQDPRVNPAADHNQAMRWASLYGYTEIVRLLLKDKRVDPSEAIRLASESGYIEIVKLLLKDKRVKPSTHDNYPIRAAIRNNHFEVVKLLLQDKRVDPSDLNNEAIKRAAADGRMKLCVCYWKIREWIRPHPRMKQ